MGLLESYLTEELETLKLNLANSIRSKGLVASGRSIQTLEVNVETKEGITEGTLSGESYLFALEFGRKPTTNSQGGVLLRAIRQWLIDKGLDGKLNEYAVTAKIHREGIKVPNKFNSGNVISDVINKSVIDNINKQVTTIISTGINQAISKVL